MGMLARTSQWDTQGELSQPICLDNNVLAMFFDQMFQTALEGTAGPLRRQTCPQLSRVSLMCLETKPAVWSQSVQVGSPGLEYFPSLQERQPVL